MCPLLLPHAPVYDTHSDLAQCERFRLILFRLTDWVFLLRTPTRSLYQKSDQRNEVLTKRTAKGSTCFLL